MSDNVSRVAEVIGILTKDTYSSVYIRAKSFGRDIGGLNCYLKFNFFGIEYNGQGPDLGQY
jgi:hypothetical protein